MGVQLIHPLEHQFHITMQQAQLLADRARLLAHPCIFENRPHRVERGHASGGGYNPDPCREPFADNLREIGVQFCINRFGWQEHQRAIGSFTLKNVALRNCLDMAAHRCAKGAGGVLGFLCGLCCAQCLIGL